MSSFTQKSQLSKQTAAHWQMYCPVCQLPGLTTSDRAEVELFRGLHDDMQHNGHPAARVRGYFACGECSAPASRLRPVPGGVVPVCPSCLHGATGQVAA